ncbi:MAG: hypothetical protein IPH31_12020 [Lewinellaceae bacterium]|nr:hypothetical protein [Lewinellaceae bacterium]
MEKEHFIVTGICSNTSGKWQKIWLEAIPLDAIGKPLSISRHASVIVATFSDAVPPNGRTSFYASWPLTEFSGKPASCNFKVAGAVPQDPGPILANSGVNGIKMFEPSVAGQAAPTERGWQVSGTISNPLEMVASNARLEILLYGTDNKLWMSTVINPDDPAIQPVFSFDRPGPMQPREERGFSLQVYYAGLPQALKDIKIGRVEIWPFEARQ